MNNYYRHIDVFKVAQPFVFLFSSFIGVYLSELAVFEYDPTRLVNLVENIAFSSLLFSIMVLIFNQYAIKIFKYIFLLLLVFTILEGVYFLIFRAEFTSSAIFIGLDTNTREIGEFVQFNLANTHLFFAFGVMISFYLSWYFFKPKLPTMSSFRRLFMLFVASLGIFIMSTTKVQNYNVFFAIVNSVLDYNKQRNQFQNLELVQNPFSEVTQLSDSIKTHVIVIGESTSKLHFGLYGYERNTTPMLSEIKGELKLFSDVVSGDTNTIGSLIEALVIKKENKLIGNVIQLFKQAGFKTYWLSNQPPIGMYETLVTKIGISADDVRFLNSENYYLPTTHDEVLIPELHQALSENQSKKIIFIHLMGTHANYAYRYPTSFAKYPTNLNDRKLNTINHYDNAVLYTDHIIRSIIETVRNQKAPASVLYFSDHGEEVYDSLDFVGHSPNGLFSLNMVEIPFLLWGSNTFEISESDLKRKFSLNDLSHSIADLCNVFSMDLDPKRSIFNHSFVERPRIVRDTILVK